MPQPVDARERGQHLGELSARLRQTDLLVDIRFGLSPRQLFNPLISAASKRGLDILETAAILVPPRKWRPGSNGGRRLVEPLTTQSISIHLKPNYVSGADAILTFQQEQDVDGRQSVEQAHFESPHLGRGNLSRAYQNMGLAFTHHEHQKVEGVEFYLDEGDLSLEKDDGWGKITTMFTFKPHKDHIQRDEIFQTYTPLALQANGPSKVEVRLENPYKTNTVKVRSIYYSTGTDNIQGQGAVENKYSIDNGNLIDSSRGFWGHAGKDKLEPHTNVQIFSHRGLETIQAAALSMPGQIDIERLIRNLAQGEFALAGIWAPQQG